MKTDLFQSRGQCWLFQICCNIECSTFTASSFRIWNSSTEILSPPVALFIVMLPKAHLISHYRMSGSRWVITPSWLSGLWRSFLYSSYVYSCHLVLIPFASVRAIQFLSFIVSIFACNFSFSSVQFSRSVVSNSLRPHEPQHARPPCLSPTPGVYPNSCPLSRWCHPTISSSVIPFSSCLQSFPASGSFHMSHPFAPVGQNIGVSASTSVLPMNTRDWSPLGWTGWISLQSKGLSRVSSNTTVQKHVPLVTLIFLKRSLLFPSISLHRSCRMAFFYIYITLVFFPITLFFYGNYILFFFFFKLGHSCLGCYLSLLFFRTLHSDGCMFPFLLCPSLLFFPQLL